MSTHPVSRRAFLGMGAAVLVPALFQEAGPPQGEDSAAAAPLWQPNLAGRARTRVTDYENDPFIVNLEKRLRCTCGCNLDVYTCRTTDFTCSYAPQLHREVVALVEQDKTAEEIIDAFIGEYGETALMAPPKKGFNWAGYLFPGVVITIVGSVLTWALVRRRHVPAPVAAIDDTTGFSEQLSAADADRLQAELDRLEG